MKTYIFLKLRRKPKYLQDVYFAYILALENDKILIFFATGAPGKALQKLHRTLLLASYGGYFAHSI